MENVPEAVETGRLARTISNLSLQALTPKSITSRYRECTSLEKCKDSEAPTIGYLKRHIGEEKTKGVLKLLLIDLNKFLNLKNGLDEDNIDFVVDELTYGEMRNLNMAEINMLISDIKRGRIGELYESISAPKIISYFEKYFAGRADAYALLNQRDDNQKYGTYQTRSRDDKELHEAKLEHFINTLKNQK